MTVNVDGKPFAARVSRPGETSQNFRARWQAFEQHLGFLPSVSSILGGFARVGE
jgi:hypothetical protein